MKIGIFGGCFNPVHNMHKDITINLIKKGYLDKVIFVPTGDNYDKKDLALHKDRVEMLNLVVDNVNTFVSDISRYEQYVYTYQVMDYYKKIYKEDELYFILGTDNLEYLYKWRRYEYILENYKLLVIARNSDDINKIIDKYTKFKDRIIIAKIKSRELSSTMLREYIKERKHEELKEHMDKKVIQYLKQHGLYK